MVWSVLSNWSGAVEIDGTRYASVSEIPRDLALYDDMNILLKSSTEAERMQRNSTDEQIYRIKVKSYPLTDTSRKFLVKLSGVVG